MNICCPVLGKKGEKWLEQFMAGEMSGNWSRVFVKIWQYFENVHFTAIRLAIMFACCSAIDLIRRQ